LGIVVSIIVLSSSSARFIIKGVVVVGLFSLSSKERYF